MTRKEKIVQTIGFNDRLFMIVGIPIVAFCMPFIFFFEQVTGLAELRFWIGFGVSLIYTTVIWLTCREIVMHFRVRFPKIEDTRTRLFWTAFFVVIGYLIIDQVLGFLQTTVFGIEEMHRAGQLRMAIAGLTICTMVLSFYEGLFLFDRWRRSQLEAEQLRRETVESQLAGLRSQVNPHFLFNSLNTLTYIIPEDPQKAVVFVQKLSRVYRYVLETRNEKLIPLEEELRFMDSYVFLLKERFGHNLQIYQDIGSEHYESRLAPLSLQILLENCVKHNIISAEQPLSIELFVEHEELVVRNNLQPKNQHMPSTGMGLQNIRNRYAYFTARQVSIDDKGGYFTVRLPLLEVPEVVSEER